MLRRLEMSKSKFKTCKKKLGGAAASLILMVFFGIVIGGIFFSN
jgi:hypothetical protein